MLLLAISYTFICNWSQGLHSRSPNTNTWVLKKRYQWFDTSFLSNILTTGGKCGHTSEPFTSSNTYIIILYTYNTYTICCTCKCISALITWEDKSSMKDFSAFCSWRIFLLTVSLDALANAFAYVWITSMKYM